MYGLSLMVRTSSFKLQQRKLRLMHGQKQNKKAQQVLGLGV